MRKTIVAAAVAWMAMGVAGSLPAAEGPMSSGGATPEERSALAPGEATEEARLEQGEVRSVRQLLGRDVQGSRGDRLGEVTEVLLDVDRGAIAYLVVSAEPTAAGDQRRIIPWRAVSTDPQTAGLTANIDADRFGEAPAAAETVDRQQGEEIHRFYGVAPYWQEESREPAPAVVPAEPAPQPGPEATPQRSEPEAGKTPLWWE